MCSWWSFFEEVWLLAANWPKIGEYLECLIHDDVCTANATSAITLLQKHGRPLLAQMAVVCEQARPFVQATYFLEGDGALSPFVNGTLQWLLDSILLEPTVMLDRVLGQLGLDGAARTRLRTNVLRRMGVGFAHFRKLFYSPHCPFARAKEIYAVCELMDPEAFKGRIPNNAAFIKLLREKKPKCVPDSLIDRVALEVDEYRRLAADYKDPAEICDKPSALQQFWKDHSLLLPSTFQLYRLLMLMVPSSAAAERCFSVLRRMLG